MSKKSQQQQPGRKTLHVAPAAATEEKAKTHDVEASPEHLDSFTEILPDARTAIAEGQMSLDEAVDQIATRLNTLDPDFIREQLTATDEADEEGDGTSDPEPGVDATASPPAGAENDPPAPVSEAPANRDEQLLAERRTKALKEAGAALNDGLEIVIAHVPRGFKLRITNDLVITVSAGTQKLERFVAEHWYSQAYGVTIVE